MMLNMDVCKGGEGGLAMKTTRAVFKDVYFFYLLTSWPCGVIFNGF